MVGLFSFFLNFLDLFPCNESITLNLSVFKYKKRIFLSKITVLWTASLYLSELVFDKRQ